MRIHIHGCFVPPVVCALAPVSGQTLMNGSLIRRLATCGIPGRDPGHDRGGGGPFPQASTITHEAWPWSWLESAVLSALPNGNTHAACINVSPAEGSEIEGAPRTLLRPAAVCGEFAACAWLRHDPRVLGWGTAPCRGPLPCRASFSLP